MAAENAKYSPLGNQVDDEQDNYATANKNMLEDEDNSEIQLLKQN